MQREALGWTLGVMSTVSAWSQVEPGSAYSAV